MKTCVYYFFFIGHISLSSHFPSISFYLTLKLFGVPHLRFIRIISAQPNLSISPFFPPSFLILLLNYFSTGLVIAALIFLTFF